MVLFWVDGSRRPGAVRTSRGGAAAAAAASQPGGAPSAVADAGGAPCAVADLPGVELISTSGERSPAPPELAVSLYLIRRALLLMEEVFESEQLATSYSHPLYLGMMNWFARWAYAPLFRMWWPLLKTMYPEPFTRFLEKHFSLVSIDPAARHTASGEEVFHWIERNVSGFARTCWELAGGDVPPGRTALSYHLRMLYKRTWQYRVQSAQVIVDESAAGAVIWRAEDFFVPPGLWGVGIGTDFLATLRDRACNGLKDVRYLVVQVSSDPRGGTPARKLAANEMQLYRTAGFCDALLEGNRLVSLNCQLVLPDGWVAGDTAQTQWMVASVG
jgi:hypothetical protein